MPATLTYCQRVLNELVRPGRLEALAETVIAIVLIVAGTRLVYGLAVGLLRRSLRPGDPQRPAEREAQIRTLVPLAESVLRYILYFSALIMVLDRLRFNVSALVASAGLLGVAVGFGAQSLIRDVIAGSLLLFEGLLQVGDIVRIGDVTGEVERVSLRTTQVRRYSGELVTFPNGQILQFGNLNRGFMRAIVQVGVAYEADLQTALVTLQRVGAEWAAERADVVLAPPEVQAITDFGATEVLVRLVVMVRPPAFVTAERELRLRLKTAFDRQGIGMVSPRRVVYLRGTGDDSPAGREADPRDSAGGPVPQT
ncbi:MAG: mechanosensitive ion channel family protein [Armatimonadota bacterium]|nr:mechanosensitive ion channel family protein [Armatimonadota bacterium]